MCFDLGAFLPHLGVEVAILGSRPNSRWNGAYVPKVENCIQNQQEKTAVQPSSTRDALLRGNDILVNSWPQNCYSAWD